MDELPEDQFAQDRADDPSYLKRSLSSSDLRAQSVILATAYANMAQIYENKFGTYVDSDGMRRWEKDWFPDAVDASQPLVNRRANLISKIRAIGGISMPAIMAILDPVFAQEGLMYDLVTWCGMNGGAWILDVSPLDVDTYLSFLDPLIGAAEPNPLDCDLDYAAAGLTAQDLIDIQRTAYTSEVRIYGTASAAFLAKIDKLMTQYEPARSTHYIFNSFPGPIPP